MKYPSKEEVASGRCGTVSEDSQVLEFRRLIRGANLEMLKSLTDAIAAESRARHLGDVEAREKAEAEAFGARFHRLLLAAMKRGSTNVVDILDSAMWAAGVGSVNRDTGAVSGPCTVNCSDPRGIHAVAGVMGGTANPHDLSGLNSVVRGEPKVVTTEERSEWSGRHRRVTRLDQSAPEKSEPAPPAYSVEERRVRADVAAKLANIMESTGFFPSANVTLEDCLAHVERLSHWTRQTEARVRDAALEEAAKLADTEAARIGPAEVTGEAVLCVVRAIRALKSKPAPQPSENPGDLPKPSPKWEPDSPTDLPDEEQPQPELVPLAVGPTDHDFGWALAQMRAGKKVRRREWGSVGYLLVSGEHVLNDWGVAPNWSSGYILATDWEVAE